LWETYLWETYSYALFELSTCARVGCPTLISHVAWRARVGCPTLTSHVAWHKSRQEVPTTLCPLIAKGTAETAGQNKTDINNGQLKQPSSTCGNYSRQNKLQEKPVFMPNAGRSYQRRCKGQTHTYPGIDLTEIVHLREIAGEDVLRHAMVHTAPKATSHKSSMAFCRKSII